jgi:CheY-like chemotaxis protein
MRVFFDYITQGQVLYDYQGGEFPSPEHAFDFAEATLQNLKNSVTDDWKGWSVEVRNDKGTNCFSLPVDAGPQVTTNEDAAWDQSVKPSSSLLIIEDTHVHNAIISHIAGKAGFNVTQAHSYEEACKLVSAQRFDCITLDLGLGEHAGFEVLRYLAVIGSDAQIIIISQSDEETRDDIVELGRALGLNMCVSVSKPIDLRVLRDTLAHTPLKSPLQMANLQSA